MRRVLILLLLLVNITVVSALDSDIFLCVNDQPLITYDCPSLMNQSTRIVDNTLLCSVNVSDTENVSLPVVVSSVNTTSLNVSLFNSSLSINGMQSAVGPHMLTFTAQDFSNCLNSQRNEEYVLIVSDINDPPENVLEIPQSQFGQGNTIFPYALNDFFDDPDGDSLNYTAIGMNFLTVDIFPSSDVLFTTQDCGTEYIIFRATDPYNLSDESDPVAVKVICASNQQTGDTGGHSGGGAGSTYTCKEKWQCTDWGDCLVNGTRSKTCIDLNGCSERKYIRTFTEECVYDPTCSDGLQNGDEQDVDCGGSECKPCGTCDDGFLNQDEEAIDCGGSYCEPCYDCTNGVQDWDEEGVDCGGPICEPCPSCFDGIKNANEEGVDCGGDCAACASAEQPTMLASAKKSFTLLFILLGVLAVAVGVGLRLFRKQVLALISELGWFLVGKRPKEILLTSDDKNHLLHSLLKASDLDQLVVVARDFLAACIDEDFTFSKEDLFSKVAKKVKHSSLKHSLLSFYDMLIVFEKGVDSMAHDQYLSFIQEIQFLITSVSVISGDEPRGESTSLELSGHHQFYQALYNTYLALRFEELIEAKKHFLDVLAQEERLHPNQRSHVQAQLLRLYHEVRYELSWEGLKNT